MRRRLSRRGVDVTIEDLEAWPLLYRYEPGRDGFGDREGAFVPASWWAVAALAATGRVDEARERADALCALLRRLMARRSTPRAERPWATSLWCGPTSRRPAPCTFSTPPNCADAMGAPAVGVADRAVPTAAVGDANAKDRRAGRSPGSR